MNYQFFAISFFLNLLIVINCFDANQIHFNAIINSKQQNVLKKDDNIELTCHPNVTKEEALTKLVIKFGDDDKNTLYTYNATATDKDKVVLANLTNWELKDKKFDNNGMASFLIVKANSTKSGKYICDVYINKTNTVTKHSKDLKVAFWAGNIEPNINLTAKEIKKGEAFVIECQPKIQPTLNFSVAIIHTANKIDKIIDEYTNKTNNPKNEKDGIKVESLGNSTAKIKVTDHDKKAEGSYKCEYTVNVDTNGSYKISSEQIPLIVNAGTTFKLSFSLLVISLISVLRV